MAGAVISTEFRVVLIAAGVVVVVGFHVRTVLELNVTVPSEMVISRGLACQRERFVVMVDAKTVPAVKETDRVVNVNNA